MPFFQVYPEQLVGRVVKKTLSTVDLSDNEFFESVGYYFVEFVSEFGYGDVLALLGRQLRDFLNGLDNLHEYLKYSYPRYRCLGKNAFYTLSSSLICVGSKLRHIFVTMRPMKDYNFTTGAREGDSSITRLVSLRPLPNHFTIFSWKLMF